MEPVEVLLGAVRAGLAVLRDPSPAGHGQGAQADPHRIEAYLDAVLTCCITPGAAVPAEAIRAVRSACTHLQARELPDAYLALHTAHGVLAALRGPDDH